MEKLEFKCNGCGHCCEKVGSILKNKEKAQGFIRKVIDAFPYKTDDSGVCEKFDKEKRQCSVYDDRPLMCNVSKLYDDYPELSFSKLEWYRLNSEICLKLQADGKKRKCG